MTTRNKLLEDTFAEYFVTLFPNEQHGAIADLFTRASQYKEPELFFIAKPRNGGIMLRVALTRIVSLVNRKKYTQVTVREEDEKFVMQEVIGYLKTHERLLKRGYFVKIKNGCYINLIEVEAVEWSKGTHRVKMTNKKWYPVSRTCAGAFLEVYKKWNG